MEKNFLSDDYRNARLFKKNNTKNPFLNFLELLKMFCFGASKFGHVTALFLEFFKKNLTLF